MKSNKKTEYSRHYRRLSGVSLSGIGEPTSGRLYHAENMYRDYDGCGGAAIESIPGYRQLTVLPYPISRIYAHRGTADGDCLIIHAGKYVYRMPVSERDGVGELQPIAALSGEYSRGFAAGDSFYLIDGEGMTRIDRQGGAHRIGVDEPAYVPTTFVEGERYEERNLISDECTERFTVSDGSYYAYGSKGLIYRVTDPDLMLCAVVGANDIVGLDVHIPSHVEIGGEVYRVTEIADNAFCGNQKITLLRVAEGVERIGRFALSETTVERVELPSTLTEIGSSAFYRCGYLTALYIKEGLEKIGRAAFAVCPSLESVLFSGDEDAFSRIDTSGELTHLEIIYGEVCNKMKIALPVHSDSSEIKEALADGVPLDFKTLVIGRSVKWVTVELENSYDLNGKEITLRCIQRPYRSGFGRSGSDGETDGKTAVLGCRICESLDGRVFLSANPSLPNTVFYTARRSDGGLDPTYIGASCYFNDGVGGYPVTALLAVRDRLAVFKAGDDGSGGIFYHDAKSTGDDLLPTVYPVSSVHSGVGAYAAATSFLDDPVFLTPLGLTALTKSGIDSERSLAVRSESVNFSLLKEVPDSLSLTEWRGYLVLGAPSRIYLADSRSTYRSETGDTQYDWFCLSGIGSYKNSARVYRYASACPEGYGLSDTPDEICEGVVYSEENNGEVVYFEWCGDRRIALYPTEEKRGGEFFPAVCYLGLGEHLFFGTSGGAVSVFNLDKRGIPPERLAADPDFAVSLFGLISRMKNIL